MLHQELLSPKSSTRRGWRRHCLVGQNGEDKDLAKRELYHSDPMGVVYWRQGGGEIPGPRLAAASPAPASTYFSSLLDSLTALSRWDGIGLSSGRQMNEMNELVLCCWYCS